MFKRNDIVIVGEATEEEKINIGWRPDMCRYVGTCGTVYEAYSNSVNIWLINQNNGLVIIDWPISAVIKATQAQAERHARKRRTLDLKKQAKRALEARIASWPVPACRYRMLNKSSYALDRTFYRNVASYAHALAKDPYSWEAVFNAVTNVATSLTARWPTRIARLLKAYVEYGYPEGRGPGTVVWHNTHWWKDSPQGKDHFAHVSENKALVAYYQNADKFVRKIATPIKPGAYLRKYFKDVLDEAEIKRWAEKQAMANVPPKVYFVENTDPDGWEQVYESGSGFTSCMVYDRDDRYLEEGLVGPNHPVRSYCHPGNSLRLAWLGKKYPDGTIEVAARTIVHEGQKAYVRVYGDERLGPLLRTMGYGTNPDMDGVTLLARKHPTREDAWVVPYFDGTATQWRFSDDQKYIIRGKTGPFCSTSAGWVVATMHTQKNWSEDEDDEDDDDYYTCEDCGARVHVDNIYSIGYHGDYTVGDCCIDNYTYVTGRRNNEYYVPNNEAVHNESDGCDYHSDFLGEHNIGLCEYTDNYYDYDELVTTADGEVNVNDAISLDEEDSDGNSYAYPGCTKTLADGRVVHEDEAQKDAVTTEWIFEPDAMTWQESATGGRYYWRTYYTLPDSVKDNPDAFSVIDDRLYLGKAERGALTLTEWLVEVYDGTNEPVNCSDGNEASWQSVFDEMQYDLKPLAEVIPLFPEYTLAA